MKMLLIEVQHANSSKVRVSALQTILMNSEFTKEDIHIREEVMTHILDQLSRQDKGFMGTKKSPFEVQHVNTFGTSSTFCCCNF